jgi:catechol 2,3-dioxygenase-like lactoylglutathione lyase family enzyme
MTGRWGSLLVGVIAFGLGAGLTAQFVRGQPVNPIDGPLTHVGMVVHDIERSSKVFGDVLGVDVPPPTVARGVPIPPSQGGGTMQVKLTNLVKNNIRIELIEPVGESSPWRDFLDTHGEGVHHLGFTVGDVSGAVEYLEDKGGRWVMGNEDVEFGYVDMLPQLGVTIEVLGAGVGP